MGSPSRRLLGHIHMPRATSSRFVQEMLDEDQESEWSESGAETGTDEEQADVPRVAQWIDDDELQELADPQSKDEISAFVSRIHFNT